MEKTNMMLVVPTLAAGYLLASCSLFEPTIIPIDSCAWVKKIETKDVLIRGDREWRELEADQILGRDRSAEVLFSDRDILTPSTAGKIVALKKAVEANCKDS